MSSIVSAVIIVLILGIQHLIVPKLARQKLVYVLPAIVFLASLYLVWFKMSGWGTIAIGIVLSCLLGLITLLAGITSTEEYQTKHK